MQNPKNLNLIVDEAIYRDIRCVTDHQLSRTNDSSQSFYVWQVRERFNLLSSNARRTSRIFAGDVNYFKQIYFGVACPEDSSSASNFFMTLW